MARACLTCQQGKILKHIHVWPQHIPVPSLSFSHMHVDLVGDLPFSEGFINLFMVIDRTTSQAEAIPFQSMSAAACARAQFTSSLWATFCTLLGIKHVQTTAFHPEGHRLVEQFHCCLKDALRAHCTGSS